MKSRRFNLILHSGKYLKNTAKIAKNSNFSKLSKINFIMMDWDMSIGVISDENTSLRCVLNHSSPFYHAHNRNPPPTYPHRRFLAIFREVWNKMLQKIKFLVNIVLLTKSLEIAIDPWSILTSNIMSIRCLHPEKSYFMHPCFITLIIQRI